MIFPVLTFKQKTQVILVEGLGTQTTERSRMKSYHVAPRPPLTLAPKVKALCRFGGFLPERHECINQNKCIFL